MAKQDYVLNPMDFCPIVMTEYRGKNSKGRAIIFSKKKKVYDNLFHLQAD